MVATLQGWGAWQPSLTHPSHFTPVKPSTLWLPGIVSVVIMPTPIIFPTISNSKPHSQRSPNPPPYSFLGLAWLDWLELGESSSSNEAHNLTIAERQGQMALPLSFY